MTIPLVRIDVMQCGCNIWWYAGEVDKGKFTRIDQVHLCPEHERDYRRHNDDQRRST